VGETRINGHSQFEIRDANGADVAGATARASILAGYGEVPDALSRSSHGQPEAWANAELIVRATASHEALIAALENTADALEVFAGIAPILRADEAWQAAVGRARAALAAARSVTTPTPESKHE
jgi:hypothetical protein